jgi:hypothetical protein
MPHFSYCPQFVFAAHDKQWASAFSEVKAHTEVELLVRRGGGLISKK